MELTALALLALGVLLAEPLSRWLAVARWPTRDPVGGLLLWQAIGLAGGLSLLGAGIVFGLAPFGSSLPRAVAGAAQTLSGAPAPPTFDVVHGAALAVVLRRRLRVERPERQVHAIHAIASRARDEIARREPPARQPLRELARGVLALDDQQVLGGIHLEYG